MSNVRAILSRSQSARSNGVELGQRAVVSFAQTRRTLLSPLVGQHTSQRGAARLSARSAQRQHVRRMSQRRHEHQKVAHTVNQKSRAVRERQSSHRTSKSRPTVQPSPTSTFYFTLRQRHGPIQRASLQPYEIAPLVDFLIIFHLTLSPFFTFKFHFL